MVVLARLQWLRRQLHSGLPITAHFSHNSKTSKDKVTFKVGSVKSASPTCSVLLAAAIDAIASCVHGSVVVDRGHKFSDGSSEVSFWLVPAPDHGGISLQHDASQGQQVDQDSSPRLGCSTTVSTGGAVEPAAHEPMDYAPAEKYDTKSPGRGGKRRRVRVRFRNSQLGEWRATITATAPMREALVVFCSRNGLQISEVRCSVNGVSFAFDATAEDIGIEDKGCIDVSLAHPG